MEKITYPIRINRYLALNNYCSRREADILIERKVVQINGKIAQLGDKVNEGDRVEVDTRKRDAFKNYRYFAYNKPRGIITHSPQGNEKSIQQVAGLPADVFPVGRLDKDSHGLILLTNDGRVTDKLLNPEYEHEKEYIVRVDKNLKNIFLKVFANGIQLEDFKTKECRTEKIDDFTFRTVLTEGKKHQIRRMCAAEGYAVQDLKRVRVMNIKLGSLKMGQSREIKGTELDELLKQLHLDQDGPS